MKRITLLLLFITGCANTVTEEGFVGYVYHIPLFVGNAHYIDNQVGPTSTGMVWRQFVTNVDVRPKNYTEQFNILSRDNLNVGFEAHARISVRPSAVAALLDEYSDIRSHLQNDGFPRWYERAVRQPFRTAVRDVVHGFDAYTIQSETQVIGQQILLRLEEEYLDSPFVFETMSIGNLSYPAAINAEIQRKLAAEQDLERMDRERQIAEQEAEIMITTARGRAAAQRIVNETLTPLYVQHEMLEGFKALSRTSRATIVSAPIGEGVSSPIILGLGN
jgi:regulator of protease activity HflC (stomatin/prohibitin superfamily)